MRLITWVLLMVLLFAYASVGGVIFHYLEVGYEQNLIKEVNDSLNNYISNSICFTYPDVVALAQIMDNLRLGSVYINSQGNLITSSRFDFRSSIYVASELYVGIGYKDLMPVTAGGRAFIIFYVLISIFLLFTVMYFLGKLMDPILNSMWKRVACAFCLRHKTLNKLLRQLVPAAAGAILFLLIPAVIFSYLEKWTYGRALYYCCISLFTLGFGDSLAGMNYNVGLSEDFLMWYRIATGFWIIISLMWFGSILIQFNSAFGDLIWLKTEDIVDKEFGAFDRWKEKMNKKSEEKKPIQHKLSNPTPNDEIYSGEITHIPVG